MFELLDEAQANAPSYVHIRPDGAAMVCDSCGKRDHGHFVRTFTPDKAWHAATHLECLDEDWAKNANDMGWL